jgi:thioredoxin-related protein
MIKNKFLFVVFVLTAISLSSFAQVKNLNEALKKAKEQDKKIILDIYTDWCGWCKKMDADVYGKSDIKDMVDDNFIFYKLNAEGDEKVDYKGKQYKASELAEFFEVSGYPTTVFLEPDGKVIEYKYDKVKMNNLPGYYKAGDFIKVLEFIRDEKYKNTDMKTII